jgi:hypothetical protein
VLEAEVGNLLFLWLEFLMATRNFRQVHSTQCEEDRAWDMVLDFLHAERGNVSTPDYLMATYFQKIAPTNCQLANE